MLRIIEAMGYSKDYFQDGRKQEAFSRTCDYNLKRLCYLKYLEELSAVDVWNE